MKNLPPTNIAAQLEANHPVSADDLIQQTKELIQLGKKSYLAASVNVHLLYESWTGSPDEWVSFYQEELDLSKSQVSKMRTVGGFLVANQLQETAKVSYEKLYRAIASNRDGDPQKILAVAEVWGEQDFKDDLKEDGHNHEYALYCGVCWKKHA